MKHTQLPDMLYLSLLFLLPLTSSNGATPPTFEAQTTQVMRKGLRKDAPVQSPPYLHLPVFVDSRLPLVEMEYFSPSRGTGQEPLPEPVREILFPVRAHTIPPSVSGFPVRTSCESKKMLVQVQRSILGTGEPDSRLTLGTCLSSKSTRDYLYFEYDVDMCGTKRTMIKNQWAYSNKLQYNPSRLQGPIRRAAPFTLPVACYYNRYQYSYKIGYTPKMGVRKIYTPMKNRAKFILTPRNAQWERLSPSDQYVLGKPMYFEAEALSLSQDKRLYVHSCYATPETSHTSTPQFPVVQNFGCMVESKDGRSKFIQHKSNAVRFSVDAFIFTGMTGHLYMHCSMSVGSSVPTPTAKSCNYDTKTRRWVELYGPDSVCTCCDFNCSSAASAVTKIISSQPWTIKPKVKSTAASKRKKVSATTSRKTAAGSQKGMSREVTEWRPTSQPGATAAVTLMGKVENTEQRLDWPFGGEGVAWVEMEVDEEQVKGFAVVEEVGKEEEEITKTHTIFEDIFDFHK